MRVVSSSPRGQIPDGFSVLRHYKTPLGQGLDLGTTDMHCKTLGSSPSIHPSIHPSIMFAANCSHLTFLLSNSPEIQQNYTFFNHILDRTQRHAFILKISGLLYAPPEGLKVEHVQGSLDIQDKKTLL